MSGNLLYQAESIHYIDKTLDELRIERLWGTDVSNARKVLKKARKRRAKNIVDSVMREFYNK